MKFFRRSFILLLIFSFLLTLPAMDIAWAADRQLIFDELGVLSAGELTELNQLAGLAADSYNVDVVFVLTASAPSSLKDYATNLYTRQSNALENAFILIIDEEKKLWNAALLGNAVDIFSQETEKELYEAYEEEDTYYDGIKEYINSAGSLLKLYGGAADIGKSEASPTTMPRAVVDSRFYDEVGLLTEKQALALRSRLDDISQQYNFDVVVAVVSRLDERSARLYAVDFFEEQGFGYGPESDGAILLIAMEGRDWGFATLGSGLYAFTDAGQDYLETLFLPYLRENAYNSAFLGFAAGVEEFLEKAESGNPYDKRNTPLAAKNKRDARNGAIILSLLGAAIVAFLVGKNQKKQLKSVHEQIAASEYIRQDSMVMAHQEDVFLHRHVSRTKKPKPSSSGSSGSFSSSSGSSASGRSGKF